jgi:hypothetical protein
MVIWGRTERTAASQCNPPDLDSLGCRMSLSSSHDSPACYLRLFLCAPDVLPLAHLYVWCRTFPALDMLNRRCSQGHLRRDLGAYYRDHTGEWLKGLRWLFQMY